jgi:hypothetical protein
MVNFHLILNIKHVCYYVQLKLLKFCKKVLRRVNLFGINLLLHYRNNSCYQFNEVII